MIYGSIALFKGEKDQRLGKEESPRYKKKDFFKRKESGGMEEALFFGATGCWGCHC